MPGSRKAGRDDCRNKPRQENAGTQAR